MQADIVWFRCRLRRYHSLLPGGVTTADNLPPKPGRLVLHIFIQTAIKRRQQVFEKPAVACRYSTHVATSSRSMESAVSFPFWNGFACKLFVIGCYAGVGICFTDFHSRRRCSYVPFAPYALLCSCRNATNTTKQSEKVTARGQHRDMRLFCVDTIYCLLCHQTLISSRNCINPFHSTWFDT